MPKKTQERHAWGPRWTGKQVSGSMWSGRRFWGRNFRRYEDQHQLRMWYGLRFSGKPYGAYRITFRGKTIKIEHLASSKAGARKIAEITLPPNSSTVFKP